MIETNIKNLVIYKNKIITDPRGSLMQLAPDIPKNPHFPEGVKNLICVIANDREKPRGGHHHNTSSDDVFNISGSALWYFLDLRDDSPTKGEEYACIVSSNDDVDEIYTDIPKFIAKKDGFLAHIHTPPGVYHLVWSISESSLIFVEAKTKEYDEDDYVRTDPSEFESVNKFKKKYSL